MRPTARGNKHRRENRISNAKPPWFVHDQALAVIEQNVSVITHYTLQSLDAATIEIPANCRPAVGRHNTKAEAGCCHRILDNAMEPAMSNQQRPLAADDWAIAAYDLREAEEYLRIASALPAIGTSLDTDLTMEALVGMATICYSRPFKVSEEDPRRKITPIDPATLFDNDPSRIETHNRVMAARDKKIVHSDRRHRKSNRIGTSGRGALRRYTRPSMLDSIDVFRFREHVHEALLRIRDKSLALDLSAGVAACEADR
jgi:hypothetical protein